MTLPQFVVYHRFLSRPGLNVQHRGEQVAWPLAYGLVARTALEVSALNVDLRILLRGNPRVDDPYQGQKWIPC